MFFRDQNRDMAEPALNQKLTVQELRKYGKHTPAQYTATLSKTPKTLRQIRNANASMNALAAKNESFLTVPFKLKDSKERIDLLARGQNLSLKEELQQRYGAPTEIEKYAAKQGKNAVNVIEQYYEGGPTVEGVGTGKKTYPVFAPLKAKLRRSRRNRKATHRNRKASRRRRN